MSIHSPIQHKTRTAGVNAPEAPIPADPAAQHREAIALITLQIARGRAREAMRPIEQLAQAARDRHDERAVADLRVLRALAELDIVSRENAPGPAERPLSTVLAFGLHVLPELVQLAAAQSNALLSYRLNTELFASSATGASDRRPYVEALSRREIEVLALLEAGASNRQIGDRLFISEGTVKKHVSRVMAKLGAENRTQAVSYARRSGLL